MQFLKLFLFSFYIGHISGYTLYRSDLLQNIQGLLHEKKGILAIDESINTIGKRFDSISCENTVQNRNSYRKLLLECPTIENYISGYILSEDTFDQVSLPDKNIIYGVKLDKGLTPFIGGFPHELSSVGLDTLNYRCKKYFTKGARFAKWRTVFSIQDGKMPSDLIIHENCWTLSRFARICQENGMVPIVEPEILMDGNHSAEVCGLAQEKILKILYSLMRHNRVHLKGTLLKTSMTLPGVDSEEPVNENEIAYMTNKVIENSVPKEVSGILFLSGGLSEVEATRYLYRIKTYNTDKNRQLSFSFGRALQDSCLHSWNGKEENTDKAQEMLMIRAKRNSDALQGISHDETGDESKSLFIRNYKY